MYFCYVSLRGPKYVEMTTGWDFVGSFSLKILSTLLCVSGIQSLKHADLDRFQYHALRIAEDFHLLFIARQHRNYVRPSVCLSVCQSRSVLYRSGLTYHQNFFTTRSPNHYFYEYRIKRLREIPTGSPQTWTWVGSTHGLGWVGLNFDGHIMGWVG